jgi:hypothetical protein
MAKKKIATWQECQNCNAGEKPGKGCVLHKDYECWLERRKYSNQIKREEQKPLVNFRSRRDINGDPGFDHGDDPRL